MESCRESNSFRKEEPHKIIITNGSCQHEIVCESMSLCRLIGTNGNARCIGKDLGYNTCSDYKEKTNGK